MPELPEVESIRSMLEKRVSFCSAILGRKILGMRRDAKYLIFDFDDASKMVVHLRMTGNLLYMDGSSKINIKSDENGLPRHARVIFTLNDGSLLCFCDQRKFGRLWFYSSDEDYKACGIDRLGPEPLSADFSKEYLYKCLAKTKRQVKAVLLDQSIVSGIGNIYSDEILFKAGILPQTRACDISKNNALSLYDAINDVISNGIKANRSSIEAYMLGASKQYSDLEKMKVYQKAGSKCMVCGTKIEKLTIGGRSSCFCPNCQR